MNPIQSPAPAPVPTPARPWLARLHPALFGMALGWLGLSGAWVRLAHAGAPEVLPWGYALQVGAVVLVVGLLGLWAWKLWRHPEVLLQEWRHPVQGALLALIPVATLMALAMCAQHWPQWRAVFLPLVLCVLAAQGVMAWHVVADLSSGKTPPEFVTPALYLPTVPGGFVGAIALESVGQHGWATLLLGMGLSAWALLEVRILHRLFAGPMAPGLRTTLGIEMAPASVGALAVSTLWPDLPADVLMITLGIASGPVLAVLTRWRYWREVPFNVGFWSFSFPLTALAGAVVTAVQRGGWPMAVSWLAVGLVTVLVGFLAAKTLVLVRQGRLLPPV